ncbi:hypothetical protein TEA_018229 [Camellia sinensis var. sinensis]|uniref:Uncharacterized protein n=1 Tax=Camellia sinensis var. sinensis TaxID=542762 RepID=A0A4S4D0U1_CAMSN|nr:hypothetical protein TEA_018229 [Camellia sinensis var. sinensis]
MLSLASLPLPSPLSTATNYSHYRKSNLLQRFFYGVYDKRLYRLVRYNVFKTLSPISVKRHHSLSLSLGNPFDLKLRNPHSRRFEAQNPHSRRFETQKPSPSLDFKHSRSISDLSISELVVDFEDLAQSVASFCCRTQICEYHCPVLNKVFTEFIHIVAVKTTGNAIKELNIRTKNWKELLTDETFTRAYLITIQVISGFGMCIVDAAYASVHGRSAAAAKAASSEKTAVRIAMSIASHIDIFGLREATKAKNHDENAWAWRRPLLATKAKNLAGYDMQFDVKYTYFNFLQSIPHPSSHGLTLHEMGFVGSSSDTSICYLGDEPDINAIERVNVAENRDDSDEE